MVHFRAAREGAIDDITKSHGMAWAVSIATINTTAIPAPAGMMIALSCQS